MPDIHPRAPAAAGEGGLERSGLDEGVRACGGVECGSAFRWCNLVARGTEPKEQAIKAAALILGGGQVPRLRLGDEPRDSPALHHRILRVPAWRTKAEILDELEGSMTVIPWNASTNSFFDRIGSAGDLRHASLKSVSTRIRRRPEWHVPEFFLLDEVHFRSTDK